MRRRWVRGNERKRGTGRRTERRSVFAHHETEVGGVAGEVLQASAKPGRQVVEGLADELNVDVDGGKQAHDVPIYRWPEWEGGDGEGGRSRAGGGEPGRQAGGQPEMGKWSQES